MPKSVAPYLLFFWAVAVSPFLPTASETGSSSASSCSPHLLVIFIINKHSEQSLLTKCGDVSQEVVVAQTPA